MNIRTKLGLSAVVGGAMVSTQTALAGNYVDITASDVATTTAYIGDLFSDVSALIWLAIGVPLAFYVIKKVISLVRGRTK